MVNEIGIIGAGSWGTALAKLLSDKGESVALWCYEEEVAKGINSRHQNPVYLSDIKLSAKIKATNDLKEAINGKKIIFSVVPSQHVRGVWNQAGEYFNPDSILVSATKGFEQQSHKLMSQVLAECLPSVPASNIVCLSGPTFAPEVARGLLTSAVIAGTDPKINTEVQKTLRCENFLTFTNEDITGVEVGGAIKNVIAIAAGMSDGLNFGHNARAAIITRGLYEMVKIGKTLGANPLTFMGLSGIGDLVLTCTADLSRNHTVGKRLGGGEPLNSILKEMKMVAEGIYTAKAIKQISTEHNINTPICQAVYQMLYENQKPRDAVMWLCSLPLKNELGSILK